MSLREDLNEEIKNAMRSKDKERLGALRLILAEVKKKEIDEQVTVTDDVMVAIASKMIKERRDSVSQYQAANRPELAAKEEAEIAVISEFLPAPLTEEELADLIREAVDATGAASIKELGKVMTFLKPKVQGRTDMGALSGKIKNVLS
ncbi:MAG: GatB/YqeY domain-containing protein [Succinivibrionaceae bacterium]